MIIVGLTGGIGSGKSKILNFLKKKGFPCYDSDKRAKQLVNSNLELKNKIKKEFGNDIYKLEEIDSKTLSNIVFNKPDKLKLLNSIIHPYVRNDFNEFKLKTKASLVFKESAIMFESKTNLLCDFIVLIKAPIQVRINRITKRDLIDESIVKSIMLNQWSDEKKEVLSDKIIENIDWKQTILLVEKLLVELKIQFNITD
ncbi:MAG: dephospho-CoA kinase [Flavobacteriaceae bacterium]|nr:dephospho-CoA kinase [Flavobacteriaceae bacterium]|tara:strand:+ start:10404 stop:11000 length:597 start_codon:yes stop_codon:yes gene_type:complete